jgi:hypothetical protein
VAILDFIFVCAKNRTLNNSEFSLVFDKVCICSLKHPTTPYGGAIIGFLQAVFNLAQKEPEYALDNWRTVKSKTAGRLTIRLCSNR